MVDAEVKALIVHQLTPLQLQVNQSVTLGADDLQEITGQYREVGNLDSLRSEDCQVALLI